MLNYNLNKRPFIFFLVFAVIITVITLLVIELLNSWKKDIIEGKKVLTEVVVEKLDKAGESFLDSLYRSKFFDFESDSLLKKKLDYLDKRLKEITSAELIHLPGIEGGFYFQSLNEFYGYAFPTSPPPMPAFGPPPRSYNIIKEQVLASIEKDTLIIEVHSFDPAIFPLATKPAKIDSRIVGAAWARIHVERDLPALKLNQIIQIAGIFFLVAFFIAFFTAIRLRKRMENIKFGLQYLEKDTSFRFENMPGVFGFIGASINKLVAQLTEMHNQKQYLERELYQQDKLATLGKLIAGVAHEVKTPLAIIKTRIQIWQHELKKKDREPEKEVISPDAMQLVVNEIDRLTKLVKRLLVFSKPVSDKFQPVNITKLLMQIISLFQIENNQSIKITASFDNDAPLIQCDPNAIEQVFINILTNSIESLSDSGEITITTRAKKENGLLTIEISDNGSGIPEDIKDKIFDPFFSTKQNGVGLGLSIAYEVIKAHKGKIYFSSLQPSGTSCIIELNMSKK
jgi:signal transduction histidine kinase